MEGSRVTRRKFEALAHDASGSFYLVSLKGRQSVSLEVSAELRRNEDAVQGFVMSQAAIHPDGARVSALDEPSLSDGAADATQRIISINPYMGEVHDTLILAPHVAKGGVLSAGPREALILTYPISPESSIAHIAQPGSGSLMTTRQISRIESAQWTPDAEILINRSIPQDLLRPGQSPAILELRDPQSWSLLWSDDSFYTSGTNSVSRDGDFILGTDPLQPRRDIMTLSRSTRRRTGYDFNDFAYEGPPLEVDWRGLGWLDNNLVAVTWQSGRHCHLSAFDLNTMRRLDLFKFDDGLTPYALAWMHNGYWDFVFTEDEMFLDGRANADQPDESTLVRHPTSTAWQPLHDLLTASHHQSEWPADPAYPDAWTTGITADFPPDSDITCDPATFQPSTATGELVIPHTMTIHHPDPTAIHHTLTRAADRILRLDAHGTEYLNPDDLDHTDLGSPRWAHPQITSTTTVTLYIDTGDHQEPLTHRSILHILRDELRHDQITSAHLGPAN